MSERDTLAIIAEEFGLAFSPLSNAVETPALLQSFMTELGWNVNNIPVVASLTTIVQQIIDIVEAGDITMDNVTTLLGKIKDLITEINGLKDKADSSFQMVLGTANEIKNDLPGQLVQYLLAEYFLKKKPKIGSVLQLFGIIALTPKAATATRPAYIRREIHFEKIPQLVTDPLKTLRELYGWATPQLDREVIFERLTKVFESFKTKFSSIELPDAILKSINNVGAGVTTEKNGLRLKIFDESISNVKLGAGIDFYINPANGSVLPGLTILPYASGSFATELPVTDNLGMKIETSLAMENGVAVILRPGQMPALMTDLIAGSVGGLEAALVLALKYAKPDGAKTIVIGAPDASRYEFESAAVGVNAKLNRTGSKDVGIEFDLKGSKIVIKPAPGESDGFLAKLLPPEGITMAFELGFGFSIESGFYFKGSSGLEITLPAHLQLGPIEINNTTLGIHPAGNTIPIAISVGVKAALGPIVATVDGIGIIARFSFPPERNGNLGPVNFELAFKPPTMVGLSIDAGIVKGGGFLLFDQDKGEYAGGLELMIQDTIQVAAIGIINTKFPDGTKGFSMLIILSVQFSPGIALGMGFFLNGLGGMLGINRTINVEALREGVSNNALDSILFPEDIVANINTLLPQLKSIFPVKKDQFFIGLMAKITWGVPTLVSVEFGIAMEFTNPVRLAIMGVLKVVLPTEEAAILKLQVNFLGIIDFTNGYLSFDASIVNSRILTFTLEGDMALRLNWGKNKGFLLSVGGFHPAFTPPAELNVPKMKRLSLTIFSDNPLLRISTYFAVTSNSVQFGAKLELKFEAGPFSIEGHLGFDVLFQFSPFRFIASIYAGIAVKCGGSTLFSIDLEFNLSGPTPWNANGTASFSILFITIKVRFNVTWGEEQNVIEPPIPVIPKLLEALNTSTNWTAEIPSNKFNLVSLKDLVPAAGEVILQSFGALKISQTILPLNIDINRFGNHQSIDLKLARITKLTVGTQDIPTAEVRDSFAPSAFRTLKDDEKLAAPSYTKEVSGVTISDNTLRCTYGINRTLAYDCTVSDFDPFPTPLLLFRPFGLKLFRAFVKGGDIGRSALSIKSRENAFRKEGAVLMDEESYTIVNNGSLTAHGGSFTKGSKAEAEAALNEIIRSNPKLKKKLSVSPSYQLEPA
ncbi:MAG: DUF6603 domain-containing protein [Flavitalea sp.]